MSSVIDPTYLPFTREQLRQHFTGSTDRNLSAFEKSAARYRAFLQKHPDLTNISLKEARTPRQIEKDETFWTAACLKALYEHPQFKLQLTSILCQLYGALDGLATWNDCLTGDLHLYFEARLPSPQTYVTWLSAHLPERQLIPYIRDAAARNSGRPLEGPSHVDALFVNPLNGFGLLIEAKVLSDIDIMVSFDNQRNQLARNIDRLRLAGRGEKIHEKVCRYGGRVPIREVWRARAMTAAVRRVLGLSETLGTCASSASNETRRS